MTNYVSLGWLSEQVWVLFINYGVAFLVFLYLLPHCGKLSKIGNPLPPNYVVNAKTPPPSKNYIIKGRQQKVKKLFK